MNETLAGASPVDQPVGPGLYTYTVNATWHHHCEQEPPEDAYDAGTLRDWYSKDALDAAVAAERERCARICEAAREAASHSSNGQKRAGAMAMAASCAMLIRA